MITRLLNENKLDLISLFENLQLVYLGCFQELIRQVSIECLERGNLIQKIWNAYINLFERAIIEQAKGISQIEIENLKENGRLHKLYQKEIERLKQSLNQTSTEKHHIETEATKLNENFKYAKKKNSQLEKDCHFFKTNYENMRTEYNLINEDNIALKSVIEKNFIKDKQNDDVEYILRKLPKREKKLSVVLYDHRKLKKEDDEDKKLKEEENILAKRSELELCEEDPKEDNESLCIDDKCIDTNDLMPLIEDKAIDTCDLVMNSLEKIDKIDEEGQISTNRNEEESILDNVQTMFEKEFPRLSRVVTQNDLGFDFKEEIVKVRNILLSFQEQMQDLKISIQEKENQIEGLMDKEGKKEQELALLSEEVLKNLN